MRHYITAGLASLCVVFMLLDCYKNTVSYVVFSVMVNCLSLSTVGGLKAIQIRVKKLHLMCVTFLKHWQDQEPQTGM